MLNSRLRAGKGDEAFIPNLKRDNVYLVFVAQRPPPECGDLFDTLKAACNYSDPAPPELDPPVHNVLLIASDLIPLLFTPSLPDSKMHLDQHGNIVDGSQNDHLTIHSIGTQQCRRSQGLKRTSYTHPQLKHQV